MHQNWKNNNYSWYKNCIAWIIKITRQSLNANPQIGVPLPERSPVPLISEPMTFKLPKVTILVLSVTLTFAKLLCSISDQFISVCKCISSHMETRTERMASKAIAGERIKTKIICKLEITVLKSHRFIVQTQVVELSAFILLFTCLSTLGQYRKHSSKSSKLTFKLLLLVYNVCSLCVSLTSQRKRESGIKKIICRSKTEESYFYVKSVHKTSCSNMLPW